MNRQRLPVVLSAAALLVAVLSATPNGIAGSAVRVALFAKNAAKVGGIAASKKPKAGKLLPLGKNGKFPASVLPVVVRGPIGPAGAEGARGPAGSAGPQGAQGIQGLRGFKGVTGPAGPQGTTGLQGLVGPPGGFGLIAYVYNGQLRVAHCSNLLCSAATSNPIDSTSTAYASLAIGADGLPLVSYFDSANADLKVAHCADALCASAAATTLDSTGTVGLYTSLTIGSDGLGLISYRSVSGGLNVAHCSDVACSAAATHTVDAGIKGEYSAITLGVDGLGVISYYDGSGGSQDLKVAHCADVLCDAATSVAVDTPGNVGWSTSITVGADGLPFVSYRDVDGLQVKGLHCPNVFCVPYLRRR
jgi:hypothetical protein